MLPIPCICTTNPTLRPADSGEDMWHVPGVRTLRLRAGLSRGIGKSSLFRAREARRRKSLAVQAEALGFHGPVLVSVGEIHFGGTVVGLHAFILCNMSGLAHLILGWVAHSEP